MLRARIKNLAKSSELYATTGQQLNVFSDNCVREIYELGKLDEPNSKLYRMFAETLKELDNVRRICMEQMQKLLATPLKRLSEQKTTKLFPKPLDDVKDDLCMARDNYDQMLRKFVTVSNQQPSAKRARNEAELATAKVVFEATNKDFRMQVSQLSSVIKLGLLEQLCMYMYVQHSSFVMGRSLLGAIEPLMRQQLAQIEAMRSRGWERQVSIRFEALTGREKEGYLYVRTHKHVSSRWAIRWVTVHNGVMSWFKKWKTLQPTDVVQLEQCSVRSSEALPLQFQLITARETLLLRALSQVELNEWVQTIENSISHALRRNLQSVAGAGGHSLTKTAAQSIQQFHRLRSTTDIHRRDVPMRHGSEPPKLSSQQGESAGVLLSLYEQSVHNGVCADCGEVDPDWASLNTGSLVCIVCASIHRSLPSGFNKTKSLTFDSWEPEQLELLRMIGNRISNEFWEFQLASEAVQEEYAAERPTKVSSSEVKAHWIRLKYIQKRFVPPPPPDCSPQALAEPMFQAVITENPFLLVTLKAFGGDVNAVSADDDQRSLVHYAVLTKNSIALELLIQSGANVDVRDANQQSPLHYAVVSNTQRCAYLLIKRGLSPHQQDALGLTPVDLAFRHRVRWAVELFGSDSKPPRPTSRVSAATTSTPVLSSTSSPLSTDGPHSDPLRRRTNWQKARMSSEPQQQQQQQQQHSATTFNSSVSLSSSTQALSTSAPPTVDSGYMSSPSGSFYSYDSTTDTEPIVPPASAKPLLRRRPNSPATTTNFEASTLKQPHTWRVLVESPHLTSSSNSSLHSSPSGALSSSMGALPSVPSSFASASFTSSSPSTSASSPTSASASASSSSAIPSNSSVSDSGETLSAMPVIDEDALADDEQNPPAALTSKNNKPKPPTKPERPPALRTLEKRERPILRPAQAAQSLDGRPTNTSSKLSKSKRDKRTKELRKLANRYNMDLPVGIRPSNVLEVAAAAAAHGEIPLFSSSAHDLLDFVNGDDLWDGQAICFSDPNSSEESEPPLLLSDGPASNPAAKKPLKTFLQSIPSTSSPALPETPKSRPPLLREVSAVFEEIAL